MEDFVILDNRFFTYDVYEFDAYNVETDNIKYQVMRSSLTAQLKDIYGVVIGFLHYSSQSNTFTSNEELDKRFPWISAVGIQEITMPSGRIFNLNGRKS